MGAGNTDSEQAQMAVEFYQAIAGEGNYLTANIDLVGHSLGGGLAGLVGANDNHKQTTKFTT
jgi:putative lipase involved disintegration of autophagic bodies